MESSCTWHGLTFKNWAKATCVLQASFTVSMAFMKLFTYPLYASRTIDLQNCSKMKYKTTIRGGSMVWLLSFQIYKQLLQVHIWLNYHWLDFFIFGCPEYNCNRFYKQPTAVLIYCHTIIDLFLSSIEQTETLNCNLSMLMARIVAWPWLDIKYQMLSQWNFDACCQNSMSRW